MKLSLAFASLVLPFAAAEVYFSENFNDDAWKTRWTLSKWRRDYGSWNHTNGRFYGDERGSMGIATVEDNRFFAISAPLDKELDNKGKTLVVQFTAKHDQQIDCGGGYIKVLPPGLKQEDFNDESVYNFMFGPDICGGTGKTHAIFSYKGKNHLIKKQLTAPLDRMTHVFTFILRPDYTYTYLLDYKEEGTGSVLDDWSMLPSRKIPDPTAKKPRDWIDDELMDDPNYKATEPEYVPDPDAQKPEDWDDDADGEWVPPKVKNPKYVLPPQVKNPKYKGEWTAPRIDNPDFVMDPEVTHYVFGYVGIDIWQVKAGTIFDDILIADDPEDAKKYYETYIKGKQEAEVEAKRKFDKEEDRHKPPPPVFKITKSSQATQAAEPDFASADGPHGEL